MNTQKLTRAIGKVKLGAIRHKSDIFFTVGMTAITVGDVLLYKAALKSAPILADHKRKMAEVKATYEKGSKEYKQAVKEIIIEDGKPLIKNHALAIAFKIAGDASLVASHVVNKKTIAGLGATTAALTAKLAKAKERIDAEMGEGTFDKITSNVKETEVVNEDGTVDHVYECDGDVERIQFVKIFDSANSINYTAHPYANQKCITDVLEFAKRKFARDGFLLYNDVLKDLGMPMTKAGCVAGWIMDEDHPTSNYIDFGLDRPENKRFMEGTEPVAILTFNCEPDIMNYLPLYKY